MLLDQKVLRYGVAGMYEKALAFLRRSAARTTEGIILNFDPAETLNVNKDGFDFSVLSRTAKDGYYYLGGHTNGGIIKNGITNGILDAGTFDEQDALDLVTLLGNYANSPEDLLFLSARNVKNKAMMFDSFKSNAVNGSQPSTMETGTLDYMLGSRYITARDMTSLAAASGNVHTSTGNTKGRLAVIYKPAIQYAYGQDIGIYIDPIPGGRGLMLTLTFDIGVGIANSVAGSDETVALAANITV